MIIDIHTHLFLPEHFIGDTFLNEVVRGGGHKEGFIADYKKHFENDLAQVDKAVVFGLNAKASGVVVPNEYIAEYVKIYPDKVIGFACVDPTQYNASQELKYCIKELGLKGVKLCPIYQHFNPQDERLAYPIYEIAQDCNIPILFHMGTSFIQNGLLEYSKPVLLERVAIDFPKLKMVIAHMGHPWESDTIVLIRKQPNIYADISALYYRPWQFYNMIVLAMEYKVTEKMFFGTDFPVATPKQSIDGIKNIKKFWVGTSLPEVPENVLDNIIHRNSLKTLGVIK